MFRAASLSLFCVALQRSPDGFLLGDWCTLMRSEYAQGRLEPDVADALAQAVPGWSWSLTDTAFEINLDALKAVRACAAGRVCRAGVIISIQALLNGGAVPVQ